MAISTMAFGVQLTSQFINIPWLFLKNVRNLNLPKSSLINFTPKFTQLPDLPEVLLPENIERNEYTPELKKSIIF